MDDVFAGRYLSLVILDDDDVFEAIAAVIELRNILGFFLVVAVKDFGDVRGGGGVIHQFQCDLVAGDIDPEPLKNREGDFLGLGFDRRRTGAA